MEFYGSIFNISGSVTASAFTGSYIGDGAGLYNLPASGVTGLNLSQISSGSAVAAVTPTGFTVNTNTTITGSLIVTGTVVSQTTTLVSGSSQIVITGTTGYSTFSSSIATTDLNQENRLTALETSSGSLNSFTSSINTTIKSKLNADGVLSGSAQILNGSNLVSSSAQVTAYGFATTGSNLFKGTQTHSGSILPSVDNTYDLGSVDYQWRDVYISSGSLYIDGTKVISSTAQELIITTDNGQSIKILEGTTDSIILQTADGDIELKSSADGDILLDPTNGKIMLKGPVEILNGQKIQSSVGGTPVVFANDIVVSGSIDLTGTIEGIDLTAFSSSVNTRISNLESAAGSLNAFTSSANSRLSAIETSTGSLNTFTSSINTTIKSKLDSDGVISGSAQVVLTGTTGYSTFSSSVSTSIGTLSGSIATTTSGLSSSIGSLSSSVATTTSGLTSTITSLSSSVSSSIGSLSSSVATTTSGLTSTITSLSSSVATTTSGLSTSITNLSSSIATTTLNQSGRLDSIEGKTGSYATTGSNIFKSSQTISGSLIITENLTVFGSSSITYVTSSQLRVDDNIITVNTASPGSRFGGLEVHDSGSVGIATGSLLWDSVNNRWIYQNSSEASYGGGVLLSGPRSSGSLGSELTLTSGRVAKSAGGDHLNDSNISDNGTTVSINSNTEITGSLIVAGGNKLTVNATGGDEGGEILLGKATTNTTLVGEGVTIDIWQNRLRFFEQGGNARGAYLDISSLANGVGTNLLGTAATASYVEYSNVANKPALVSGSSQISFLSVSNIPSGLVSGSSQVLSGTGIWSGSAQLPSGVVSGSSQVLSGTGIWSGSAQLPSGVVSGSSQISFGSITGVPSGLVSGSSQVLAGTTIHSGAFFNGISVVSGSAQISFNGITDKPTLVSGSSQISFGSITGVPGGLVSGSSQIDLTATTNYSTGIKTRLNAEGVVSGSAQITLSSTTGYSSVLNQALLTTSTPTFAELTISSNQDGKLTLRVPSSGDTSDWNYINFVGANGTRDFYFGTDSTGNPSWYRDDNGLNITLGSTATINGTQIVTNSGTWSISVSGNAATTSQRDFSSDISTTGMGRFTGWYNGNAATGLAAEIGISAGQAYLIAYNRQTSTYAAVNIESTGSTLRVSGSTVNVVNGALQQGGNQVLHAGNYTSYAMAGAGYSANQNLNTTSSPTFVGLTLSGTLNISGGASGGFTNSTLSWVSGAGGGLKIDSPGTNLNIGTGWNENIILNTGAGLTVNTNNGSGTYTSRFTVDRSGNISNTGTITTSGGIYLTDSSAALYRDNTYDIVLTQNGSSGGVLYLGGAGNVVVSIDNNNNETDRKFIVGSNAVKASNELFSVNESGNGYFSGTLQAASTLYVGGTIVRTAGGTGYLNGGYSSAETGSSTGAIYTIGGSYYPTISSLNNMYGIGYTNIGGGTAVQMTNASGWGMYVVANGTPYVWLGAEGNSSVFRGNILPHSNNSYNLGSASYGWANVYTNDLHLSNMNKPEGNDVDGTNGNWTIQEGAENLYIINNNNGKKFKIKLEEI